MLRNNIFMALIFGSFFACFTTANAEVIFSDSFESGDMLTTNSDGFAWGDNNKTSVVTIEPDCDGLPVGTSVAIWNNRTICNDNLGVGDSWKAYAGKNSLRFRYAAGQEWTEQRYDFGKGYPEVWVSYWIRVPLNYYRGSGTNNKWFNILMAPMSQYENSSVSRIEMQDWPSSTAGAFDLNIQFRNGSNGDFANSSAYHDFVTPADAGRWMHLIYHLKSSATASSTDGILRLYRKWENETQYALINELADLNVGIGTGSVSAGYLGWGSGYFMGYANSPYTNDTDWLLDSLVVSNTSLLPNPPKPPNNITVE